MAAHHKILGIVTILYLLLFLMHCVYFAWRKKQIISVMWTTLYIAFGLHTVGIAWRWIESYRLSMGHVPLSNFYESLIFYAWCIMALLIFMKKRLSHPSITLCASLIGLFLMGFASISPTVQKNIEPLVPALQSNWLHIHVATCFIAYAAFAISFIAGTLYLIGKKGQIPPKDILEEINYKCIIIGFPMLTSGILTGAVWANYAWGSYWSWDPKETWSLITWIIYAAFLHARTTRGWKGRASVIVSVTGFMSVLVTYFVVNFILSGLHSYGA